MSSAEALTALGADLTFSISFQIASELRLASIAAGVSDLELIASVLIVSIVLSAGPPSLHRGLKMVCGQWRSSRGRLSRCSPWATGLVDWLLLDDVDPAAATRKKSSKVADETPSVFQFLELIVSIARRISMSLLVQLVAAAAVSKQTRRISRVLSLLGVAIFFLFLQSGASTVARSR